MIRRICIVIALSFLLLPAANGQEHHVRGKRAKANGIGTSASNRAGLSNDATIAKSEGGAVDLRAIPLPPSNSNEDTSLYHDEPVDLNNPRAGEPLADVADYHVASKSYYAISDGSNPPYNRRIENSSERVRVRKGVAIRLAQVNRYLEAYKMELLVLDGYRTIECQTALWTHFLNEARHALGEAASQEDIERYARKYCSSPSNFKEDDPRTWPTHTTGGAVDVTLKVRGSSREMPMGSKFDESTSKSQTDSLERQNMDDVPWDAQSESNSYRRLLYWAMTKAGFRNYPAEWWHFDYGNQMWARNKKQLEQQLLHEKAAAKPQAKWSTFLDEIENSQPVTQIENSKNEGKAFYGFTR